MFFPGTPNISVPGDNVFMLFKCMCNNKSIKNKKKQNCLPENCPPMKFFCEFFRISNFYFCENFGQQEKSSFIQFIFCYK